MQISVQFFQVTATAIPTVLIALAIAGKVGDVLAQGWKDSGRVLKVLVIIVGIYLVAAVFAGEVASLAAIARGGGNAAQAMYAAGAVLSCLGWLATLLLSPIVRVTPNWVGVAVTTAVVGAVCIGVFALLHVVNDVTKVP